MSKKNLSIVLFILLLAGVSVYLNKDSFASAPIQITDRPVTSRRFVTRGAAAKAPCWPVAFLVNKELRLKSVKVVSIVDAQTNKYPHALWQLISDSNSIPTKEFVYGAPIHGMKPAIRGAGVEPLLPGGQYRLLIESASEKAQHDFTPAARTQ